MFREATWPLIQHLSGYSRHFRKLWSDSASTHIVPLQTSLHVGTLSGSSWGPLVHRICSFNSNKHVYSSKGKVKSRLSVHRGMGEFPGDSREFWHTIWRIIMSKRMIWIFLGYPIKCFSSCVTFRIIAAAFKRMKNFFCKLGIVSNIPKHKGSGTNPLITQIIPTIDPRTELKFGNLSYCS